MKEYIEELKKLNENFSYHDFINLLNKIDIDFLNKNFTEVNNEFLYYFNNLMNLINDKFMVDGKHITLGNMLIENKLLNKERITPTLLMYLYSDKKRSIGLEEYANKIKINQNNGPSAGLTQSDSGVPLYLQININFLNQKNISVDEYNYNLIQTILHEIVHVYQATRKENSNNLLDRVTYYDDQISIIIIKELLQGDNSGFYIHEHQLIENIAEETAQVYMLHTYGKRPDLFNQELLDHKKELYISRKNEVTYQYPRKSQEYILQVILDIFKHSFSDSKQMMTKIENIFNKINEIKKKQKPLLEQLKEQEISENFDDSYYNIYLKSYYQFDGKNIVIQNETKKTR